MILPQKPPQNEMAPAGPLPTLSFQVVITDPPYGVNIGEHNGATECRAGLLVKRGGYLDTPDNFSDVVVPALSSAIAAAQRSET